MENNFKICLILGKTNYLQQILEKKVYIILQYKIIIYSHASHRSVTNISLKLKMLTINLLIVFSSLSQCLSYTHEKCKFLYR